MGHADIVTREYMRKNEIFADAFNYMIYGGRRVIEPQGLQELDTAELALPFGADPGQETGSQESVQKYRDILKSAVIKRDEHAADILLGIESQQKVRYAMPVRNMIYDVLQYGKQVKAVASAHRQKSRKHEGGEPPSSAEYLSGFYRNDRIMPVITLVMHFGADAWDGPRSLCEMMNVGDPALVISAVTRTPFKVDEDSEVGRCV